jgi:hypothetical protein
MCGNCQLLSGGELPEWIGYGLATVRLLTAQSYNFQNRTFYDSYP